MPSARIPSTASCVITSYSIHYTKLYDDGDVLTSRANTTASVRYAHLALFVQADTASVSNVSSNTRTIAWDADVEVTAGPSPEVLIDENGNLRITSYNVCYTKLLRCGRHQHP